MFAVGHLALGYLIGKTSSKVLGTKVKTSFILMLAILPDVDLLIPFIKHRGPTHSLITTTIALALTYLLIGKKAIPYGITYLQHIIPGDYIAGGGIQLLWPLNTHWYSLAKPITKISIHVEVIAFLISLPLLWKTKDLKQLFHPQTSNLTLLIPLGALTTPLLLKFPVEVPPELILPHLILIALLLTVIINDSKHQINKLSLKLQTK